MTWIKNTFIDRRFASTRNWKRRSQSRTQGRWKRIRIWGWAMTKTTIIQLSHYVNNDDSDCYFFKKGISPWRKALREILQTKRKNWFFLFVCLPGKLSCRSLFTLAPKVKLGDFSATNFSPFSGLYAPCHKKKTIYFKITPLKLHSIKKGSVKKKRNPFTGAGVISCLLSFGRPLIDGAGPSSLPFKNKRSKHHFKYTVSRSLLHKKVIKQDIWYVEIISMYTATTRRETRALENEPCSFQSLLSWFLMYFSCLIYTRLIIQLVCLHTLNILLENLYVCVHICKGLTLVEWQGLTSFGVFSYYQVSAGNENGFVGFFYLLLHSTKEYV